MFNDLEAFLKTCFFRCEANHLIPLRVSSGKTYLFVLDLLLLSNGKTYHYDLIINLHKLVSKITGKEYRDRSSLCHNCLHICSSIAHLNTHQQYCLDKDSLEITMPETTKNKVAFENFSARWFPPCVIYLDLESRNLPVQTVKNNQNVSGTYALDQHLPCSYCLFAPEYGNPEPIYFDIYTDLDCMERYLTKVEKLARFFLSEEKVSQLLRSCPRKNNLQCCL